MMKPNAKAAKACPKQNNPDIVIEIHTGAKTQWKEPDFNEWLEKFLLGAPKKERSERNGARKKDEGKQDELSSGSMFSLDVSMIEQAPEGSQDWSDKE